jgi:hypothetical protein
MKKLVIFIVSILLSNALVFSQDAAVGDAIQNFKNTEFMLKYMDLKREIELEAQDFITTQNKYSAKDRRRVQLSYDKTAARFNQVMLEIKQDFLDKEKIKMINKYPKMYSDGLANKVNDLDKFYKENFQLVFTEVTEKNGFAILALIMELIKSSGELSSYFKGLKFEKKAMTEAYIQKNLIDPSKLTSWADLTKKTTVIPESELPQKQTEQKTEQPQTETSTEQPRGDTKTEQPEKQTESKTTDKENEEKNNTQTDKQTSEPTTTNPTDTKPNPTETQGDKKVEVDESSTVEKPQTLKSTKLVKKEIIKKKKNEQ